MKENLPRRTFVKICGLRNADDALLAAAKGADFLGYVFYAASPRNILPEAAGEIVQRVRHEFPWVKHVGVFVDEPLKSLAAIMRRAGLDIAQLHGNEDADYCAAAKKCARETVKALRIGAGADENDWRAMRADYYLLDTFDPTMPGGMGEMFDRSFIPAGLPLDITFIAGGLKADNVREVIASMQPYAVDVSSGVESSRGVKSQTLIRGFLEAARS